MEIISSDDNYLLKRAIKYYYHWELKDSTEQRHLSLIYSGSDLISVGENKPKSHTLFKVLERMLSDKYYTIHSEIDAILNLMRFLRTKNLYNFPGNLTMVNFRSNFRLSAPCGNCLVVLKLLNFKEVYFSMSSDSFGYIKLDEVNI